MTLAPEATSEPAGDVTAEANLPPVRKRLAGAVVLCGLAAVVLLLGQAWLWNALSWVNREPLADPLWGINYDCDYAEFLLLEDPTSGLGPVSNDRPGRVQWCAENFARVLELTGAKHVRLSVQWAQVEPEEGRFDFALVDELLRVAAEHEARVLLTVGIKAQRHPEYYIPPWAFEGVALEEGATVTDDPLLRQRALRMVEAVVAHFASETAIEAWAADNEPYVPSKRASYWVLGRDFVQAEVAAIRAHDPAGRPVVIGQAQHHVWDNYRSERHAIYDDADVLGVSFYPQRNFSVLGWDMVVPIPELSPVHPNYAAHAREAHDHGREYWITELQAEPWADRDIHFISPEDPSPNLTRGKFEDNIAYARRTGADRVYLWGTEWWLFQFDRYGDGWWMERARELIATGE